MAVSGYMAFKLNDNSFLTSESQVNVNDKSPLAQDGSILSLADAQKAHGLFEFDDFSLDIEQTLNIGSQSTGAGAGRVTFNPLSITRKIDVSSPKLFEMSCAGTPFKFVSIWFVKASGGASPGSVYVRIDLKLVAIRTMAWSTDDESLREIVTFLAGGMQLRYAAQNPDGSFAKPVVGGWNRVRNILDQGPNPL